MISLIVGTVIGFGVLFAGMGRTEGGSMISVWWLVIVPAVTLLGVIAGMLIGEKLGR